MKSEEIIGFIDEVEAYVKKLPRKERIKIGGTFHAFDLWPDELPMKPDGWDNMTRDEKWDITLPICDQLDGKAWNYKAALRYWSTQILGRSKKEFRDYWRDRDKDKEYNYIMWAYVMGICSGIQIALIIVRIAMMIKGVI